MRLDGIRFGFRGSVSKRNMIEEGPNETELELTPRLQKEGIVNRFIFYRQTSSIQVLLNHQYESKSIVASINVKDWNSVHETFEKALKRKGIKQHHILLLSDVLDDNYHIIISQGDNAGGQQQEQDEPKESAAQIALRLAGEQCFATFMDQFGTPYAAIQVDEHIETLPMKNSRFRNWLCRIFYNSEGKILTSENVTNVISLLKARADFDTSENAKSLNLRVASRPESEEPHAIYYDLTNKNWDFVRITPRGWNVVQSSKITPIIFKRYPNQQPQVYPSTQ
jgi:hypothetical protein